MLAYWNSFLGHLMVQRHQFHLWFPYRDGSKCLLCKKRSIETAWWPLTKLHQCIDEAQEGDHEVEHKHSLQLQLHPRCHGTLTSWKDDNMRHWKHYLSQSIAIKVLFYLFFYSYQLLFCLVAVEIVTENLNVLKCTKIQFLNWQSTFS